MKLQQQCKAVKDEMDDLLTQFGAFKRIGRDEEDDGDE